MASVKLITIMIIIYIVTISVRTSNAADPPPKNKKGEGSAASKEKSVNDQSGTSKKNQEKQFNLPPQNYGTFFEKLPDPSNEKSPSSSSYQGYGKYLKSKFQFK